MALNLSGTSGIVGAGIGTIGPSGANVTGVVTCTSVVSSGAISGTTGTFTGDVDIADKIIHTGDTNTAIRFPSADVISFENAGTETARTSATNQFSVGTTADVTGASVSIGGSVRLVNANDRTATISAMPSGTYNTGQSGGSAIAFHRFSEGGGGSDEIAFETHHQGNSHAESLRIEKAGDVKVNRGDLYFGTAGKGIVLGATSNTDANTLDDYEEGTWTPECKIETRAASDSPIDGVDGCYTKVGRVVTCHGKFSLNGTPTERSTSRAIEIHGFPFDHNHDWDKVSGDVRVTGHLLTSTYGDDISFVLRMIPGSQYCRLELLEHSYNGTRNASVIMQDNMYVIFSFTYVTV
tara:strand:- start:3013 stop:4068 length:1056 start_codon:yes stop_codon:yes gene_type:complete